MKYSWELYGRNSVNAVQSTANLGGYNVNTTAYGGTLDLRLSRGIGSGRSNSNNGNNGNNSNNGNNNSNNNYDDEFRARSIVLPDITLSRNHTESESLADVNPLHETRDDTRASLTYRPTSAVELNLDGGWENYRNLAVQSKYDTATANLRSTIQFAPDAVLQLTGRLTDQDVHNISGFSGLDSKYHTGAYSALLDIKQNDQIKYSYRYDFSEQTTAGAGYTTQRADAHILYGLSDSVLLRGGLFYNLFDYVQKATATTAESENIMAAEGLDAGLAYKKLYTPEFLGPFAFKTNYDFSSGFAKVTSQTGGDEGSGFYYSNSAGVGLVSRGWDKENVTLEYLYSNKRDYSPIHNNSEQQNWQLNMMTKRLPRTIVHATVAYVEQRISSSMENVFIATLANTNRQNRVYRYDLGADCTATSFLSLSAGANRGQSQSNASYSLSTLQSTINTDDSLLFGSAAFNFPFTRNLMYRATVRDDFRDASSVRSESYNVTMNLDYRIRLIFISFEYRWREDIPENSLRTTQQYYFVKLTRPF